MSRNDRGEYTPRTGDEDLLTYFLRADRPIQTAQSVADEFGLDRSQAYRRLQQLAEEGVIEKEKVGGRAVVWWLAGASTEEHQDDRSAVEERDAAAILDDLDTFLEADDGPDAPIPSAEEVRDDYHAHRHRENLERLATSDDGE